MRIRPRWKDIGACIVTLSCTAALTLAILERVAA